MMQESAGNFLCIYLNCSLHLCRTIATLNVRYPIRIVCINVNVMRLHDMWFSLWLYVFIILRHLLDVMPFYFIYGLLYSFLCLTPLHGFLELLYFALEMGDVKTSHVIKEDVDVFFLSCVNEGLDVFSLVLLQYFCR